MVLYYDYYYYYDEVRVISSEVRVLYYDEVISSEVKSAVL